MENNVKLPSLLLLVLMIPRSIVQNNAYKLVLEGARRSVNSSRILKTSFKTVSFGWVASTS